MKAHNMTNLSDPMLLFSAVSSAVAAAGICSVLYTQTSAFFNQNHPIQPAELQTGLLKLEIPVEFKGIITNDVLVEKTIRKVKKRLYVYVSYDENSISTSGVVNYISVLYNQLYDVACFCENPQLDIRIIPSLSQDGFQDWEKLILRDELNAIFGVESSIDLAGINEKRLKNSTTQEPNALTYYPLDTYVQEKLNPHFTYFEGLHSNILPLHHTVILGGTFDHLHNGHKKLLFLAASICKSKIVIGVTADQMLVSKKNAYLIESVEDRCFAVREHIRFIRPDLEIDVTVINDPFGPAITLQSAGAIVVSSETTSGAIKINEIRKDRGLPICQIFVCRRTDSSSLSSSFIRAQLAQKPSFISSSIRKYIPFL